MHLQGKSAKSYRRQLVLTLLSEEKYTQAEIARLTGLSQGYISQLLKRYRTSGASSLAIQSPPGAKAKLRQADFDQLRSLLLEEALAAGFPTAGWTLARIQQLIQSHFSVHYSLEHIRRILKKLGFSRQRFREKDYRQEASALHTWTQTTLPHLKKSDE